jgi:serine/threonine-protein kinase
VAKSFLSMTSLTGTPHYMAPEQFTAGRCDEKCDVHALGIMLNECCTRRSPWAQFQNHFQARLFRRRFSL